MRVKLLFLFLFVYYNVSFAQRGGDGGLIIQNIFVDGYPLKKQNNILVNVEGEVKVNLRHFILNEAGNPVKELPNFTDAKYYDVNAPASHLLYLPSYILPVEVRNAIPNQRLVLEVKHHKMVIDFKDIVLSNAGGYFNLIENIVFKPGHYVVHMDLGPFYNVIKNDHPNAFELVYESLKTGINTGNNAILYKYGVLEFYDNVTQSKRLERKSSAPVDSSAWLQVRRLGPDSISLFANGLLLTDGACNANVRINMQRMEDGIWSDFHTSWIQMDCGMSYHFAQSEGGIRNIHLQNVPGTNRPLPIGEYRFMAADVAGNLVYSDSFLVAESGTFSPEHYLYLERQGFGIHGVAVFPDKIQITTPSDPDSSNTEPCYYFRYYYISQPILELSGDLNIEEFYFKSLLNALPTAPLEINNKPYSGIIKLAMSTNELRPGTKHVRHDLYIIDYEEGKPLSFQTLNDINLSTEMPVKRLH